MLWKEKLLANSWLGVFHNHDCLSLSQPFRVFPALQQPGHLSCQVWIMSGSAAVQSFIRESLCWVSVIVMFTEPCSGRFAWSALRFFSHCASFLCDDYFSTYFFQPSGLCVVNPPLGVRTPQLVWRRTASLASISLVFLFSQATKAWSLCLVVSRASGMTLTAICKCWNILLLGVQLFVLNSSLSFHITTLVRIIGVLAF